MFETLFVLVSVVGCFLFAARRGMAQAWPAGSFPWVSPGLRVSDWSLAGAVLVMLPMTYFNWHSPMRPLAWLTGAFVAWVLWAWAVSAWRRG